MQVIELETATIIAAEWNPNAMDDAMRARLRRSIERFGMVVPVVVRALSDGRFETVGGAQRFSVCSDLGMRTVPCVVVPADDTEARLLSAALNRVAGTDDLGLKAELLRVVLARIPQDQVLALLPETAASLDTFASLGQGDVAAHLQAWQEAQAARLKHFTAQLTPAQAEVVEEALAKALPDIRAGDDGNPNRRGLALYHVCLAYLKAGGAYTQAYRRRAP